MTEDYKAQLEALKASVAKTDRGAELVRLHEELAAAKQELEQLRQTEKKQSFLLFDMRRSKAVAESKAPESTAPKPLAARSGVGKYGAMTLKRKQERLEKTRAVKEQVVARRGCGCCCCCRRR